LLASTFVPVLGVWLLREHEVKVGRVAPCAPLDDAETQSHESGAHGVTRPTTTGFARFQQRYASLLRRIVTVRWLVVGAYVIAAGLVIVFIRGRLGPEIFPRVDAGQLLLRLRGPTG